MTRYVLFLLSLLFALPLFAANAATSTPSATDLDARRKALNDLLKEQWEYQLQQAPVFASILGDKRYNDKLPDESIAAIKKDYDMSRKFLARFQAIEATGFPEQEALNKELMVQDIQDDLDGEKFEQYLMPVSQMGGIHLQAAQVVSLLSFTTVKDYDDYAKRLNALPTTFDQITDRMRLGMTKNLMPPRFLLEKVAKQARDISAKAPEESPFAQPLSKMPKDISEADQKRIREEFLTAIKDKVLPRYGQFADSVEKEHAPKGRTDVGIWSLPDGEARYARAVRLSTTTDMTPEQIHQLGLSEVTRIEGLMLQIAQKL